VSRNPLRYLPDPRWQRFLEAWLEEHPQADATLTLSRDEVRSIQQAFMWASLRIAARHGQAAKLDAAREEFVGRGSKRERLERAGRTLGLLTADGELLPERARASRIVGLYRYALEWPCVLEEGGRIGWWPWTVDGDTVGGKLAAEIRELVATAPSEAEAAAAREQRLASLRPARASEALGLVYRLCRFPSLGAAWSFLRRERDRSPEPFKLPKAPT